MHTTDGFHRPGTSQTTRASICLLTFNGEAFLRPQLVSILQQLHSNDEIIIVDNNSSDSTKNIIASFQDVDKRIRAFCLNRNLWIIKGFELCITLASGRYIFFCDQDDVWLPTRLEKQIASLQNADISVCNASFVSKDLQPLGYTIFDLRIPTLGWHNLLKNAFTGCTMAINREAINKILPFPNNIPMHDWYIAQASYKQKFRLNIIPEVLLLYRRHEQNASNTGGRSFQGFSKKILDRIRLLSHTL